MTIFRQITPDCKKIESVQLIESSNTSKVVRRGVTLKVFHSFLRIALSVNRDDKYWVILIARSHNEMTHGTTRVAPNALHGDRFWGLSETEEIENLVTFVKENILKAKPVKPSRANGDELQRS